MRAKLVIVVVSICCALSALAAMPADAAQRIDMKVLLLGASGTEPSFLAWQAQLRREGVPFDQLIAAPGHAPITAASLSGTLPEGTQEARYQAVIVAVGGLPVCTESGCTSALAPEEWAALQSFEASFHVRQLTAYTFPSAEYGLNPPTSSGPLDGTAATLTTAGQSVFPYLTGTVTIGAGTYGYEATPLPEATFSTLLSDPGGASLVGVVTHPDGREEMVQTFDSNPFQLHAQLLRHGELAWVTRGTFLGTERNYLELQVDDVFLPDDIWDTTNHVTDFNPADAVRMTPADVTKAVEWSRATGLRIDNVFNGGGSDAYAEDHGGSDPLLAAYQASKGSFAWIDHTYDHQNLDCSTRVFIAEEVRHNVAWAVEKGFTTNRGELVTGEHSGLANLAPGSPGTIDPPEIAEVHPAERAGTIPPGTYDYALSATSANGETIASTTTVTVPPGARGAAAGSVRLSWEAICHATGYKIYRRLSPAGAWVLVGTAAQPTGAFRDTGPAVIMWRDVGGATSAGSPASVNTAKLDPYGQNPSFAEAMRAVNVRFAGGDASKPYPVTPTSTTGPVYPAGTSFMDGITRVIPRYPTNVYYNVATQAGLIDEYNHLYLPPELGGACVNTAVTTCRSTPASWSDIVESESQRIFGHMMGNDPRPHYFHQSNLADSGSAEGAVFYPVLDAVIAQYKSSFNATEPIQQLSPTQIGELLARQEAWATAIPLSGTEAGTLYGGTRSGWVNVATGTSTRTTAVAWPAAPAAAPASPSSSLLVSATTLVHGVDTAVAP